MAAGRATAAELGVAAGTASAAELPVVGGREIVARPMAAAGRGMAGEFGMAAGTASAAELPVVGGCEIVARSMAAAGRGMAGEFGMEAGTATAAEPLVAGGPETVARPMAAAGRATAATSMAGAGRGMAAEPGIAVEPAAAAKRSMVAEPVAAEPVAAAAERSVVAESGTAGRSSTFAKRGTGGPRGMFSSLGERNYRLFAGGQVVSNVGTWMQRVAQDWLVLELSGRSPVALGIAAALQFLPTLALSVWAGALADRVDKRKLLIGVQAGMGLTGLVLGLLDVTGAVALWHVYLLCLLLGCFSSVDAPVRQAFVGEMVGPDRVANAIALNSMTFNLARIVGPAIAGVLITWIGTGWVFLSNAASFGAVIAGLAAMSPALLYAQPRATRERGPGGALRYLRGRVDLIVLLVLVFCVSTFGMTFFTTLANVAANVFHRGADGYGLLSTLMAVGTLSGSALAARRAATGRVRLTLVVGAALVFGVLEVVLGLMPTYLAFGLALIPVGAATITFVTAANATMQLSVPAPLRGRVMGVYMLVFQGGLPVGGPLSGWLAEQFGGRSPILVGGLVAMVAAVACGLVLRARRS
jgi:MFS family permease